MKAILRHVRQRTSQNLHTEMLLLYMEYLMTCVGLEDSIRIRGSYDLGRASLFQFQLQRLCISVAVDI